MRHRTLMTSLCRIVVLIALAVGPIAAVAADEPAELRVMTWNIWKGGRQDGDEIGPRKVIETIRDSGAEIVALQETYGSGERIADELGYRFHPRGTNVSILSRHPIVEDLSVFEEFKCVGGLVELPDGKRIAFFSIWLPYAAEIWEAGTRDVADVDRMLAACAPSAVDLAALREAIDRRLSDPKYDGVPIVIAGDFNAMSHLDYSAVARDDYRVEIDWPTSRVLSDAGYRDAWRECRPTIDRTADRTWTPRFPDQEQDRIDFVHYRGGSLRAVEARRIDDHPDGFPSDHAAVTIDFRFDRLPRDEVPLRLATYNIRHGEGNDHRVDLERTAAVLDELKPDFVGLQEVDLGAGRSGSVNQPRELGRTLGMHAAFGAFMDFQNGRYGMAILSKHPLTDVRALRLPDGNEPRVALFATARLPDDRLVTIVNVHFDWVDDDRFRFAQAHALADELRRLDRPFVLLGDFNDTPESRTIELFREWAIEADKPQDDSFTFSAQRPVQEIDFVLFDRKANWQIDSVRVIDEPMASDHRPVLVEARLLPELQATDNGR